MTIIGAGDVEAAAAGGRLVVGRKDLVTPLARERARELGVEVVQGADPPAAPAAPAVAAPPGTTAGPATTNALYRRGAPVGRALAPGGGARPRVAVIGAGHVGSITTLRLAESDLFDEVVLVDVVPGLAAGIALDLWHSAGLARFSSRVRGEEHLAAAGEVDYVVMTAGRPRKPGMTRTDLTAANAAIVGPVAEEIARAAPQAVVVVVTNPLEEMTHLTEQRSGFPAARVLGMAGVLDSARFCALVGLTGVADPEAVQAFALGSHGPEMVIPLSQATVSGRPIRDVVEAGTLAAIVERTRDSGAEVVKLLQSGSAYFAPGQSAALMVVTMAAGRDTVLPCAVEPAGSYGLRDTRVGLPVRLGPRGLREVVELELTEPERAALREAADRLRDRLHEVPDVRAVTMAGGGEVAVTDVPEPRIQDPGDVIVAVTLAAICGTDLHVVQGHLPGVAPGSVLGHEFVGLVLETGPAVHGLHPGDRVTTSDFTACGTCWYCRAGRHWHCPHRQFFGTGTAFGPALAGAQAERVRVPFGDTTLAVIPDGVSDVAALLVGDNLATGWVAATESGVQPGDVVAVLGGGAVGQLASLSCQLLGAGVVVVSDPVDDRRRLATGQGAVASTPETLVADLADLTAGRGADVVVEAVGNERGLDAALQACRPGGSVVSVSAHAAPEWSFPLASAFAREIGLRFLIGDAIRVRRQLFRSLAAKVLAPEVVVSGRVSLEEAGAGYRETRELRAVKVLLVP